MELVPIALFNSLPEAQRARVVLDERDIPAILPEQEIAPINPFAPLGITSGKVGLRVPENAVSEAREALRAAGYEAAVRRALAADRPRPRLWPRIFRFAGLLMVGMAALLLITRGDPVGYWLIGIGIALWAIGIIGLLRRKEEPAGHR